MTGSLETESSEPGQGCTGGQGEEGASHQEGDGQLCLGEEEHVKQEKEETEGEEEKGDPGCETNGGKAEREPVKTVPPTVSRLPQGFSTVSKTCVTP